MRDREQEGECGERTESGANMMVRRMVGRPATLRTYIITLTSIAAYLFQNPLVAAALIGLADTLLEYPLQMLKYMTAKLADRTG